MQTGTKPAPSSNGRHRQPAARSNRGITLPGATAAALTLTASGAVIATGIGGPAAADEADITAALNLLGKKPTTAAPEVSGLLSAKDPDARAASDIRNAPPLTSRSAALAGRAVEVAAAAKKAADAEQDRKNRAAAAAAAEKAAKAKERAALAAKQKAALESVRRWVLPVSGYRITATFGSSGGLWSKGHTGDDFAVDSGTRVGSLTSGTVIRAGWEGAYGYKVEVRHWDGTVSWYCHLSSISASVGEDLAPGEELGRSGSTGNSTGPHLHLEVHPGGGSAVSAINWLSDHGVDV